MTTATMAEMKKVQRALESLKESTNLTVSLRGETVSFSGLNSSYLSHQMVEVRQGHGLPQVVVFRNRHYSVAVLPYYHGSLEIQGDFISMDFPSFHFFPLFHFPTARPDWFKGIIHVVIPDRFQGFDDEGNPRFKSRLHSHCTIKGMVHEEWGETVERRVHLLEPVRWQEIGKIGCATIQHAEFEGKHCFSWYRNSVKEEEPFRESYLENCETDQYKEALKLLAPFNYDLSPLCSFDKEECDERCNECPLNNWWIIHRKEAHEKLCARFAELVAEKKGGANND